MSCLCRITQCSGTELTSAADIVQATLNNMVLNARTTIETDRYSAVMEYPVKTMNANERDNIYQTDTGPVLYPDLTAEPDTMLQQLQFAYTAVNGPDWVELVVRTPTAVIDEIDVYHYSMSVRLDARNEIIGLT